MDLPHPQEEKVAEKEKCFRSPLEYDSLYLTHQPPPLPTYTPIFCFFILQVTVNRSIIDILISDKMVVVK